MLKKCLILAALAIALFSLLPAQASDQSRFCGDLSAADCQMLEANAQAMEAVNSLAFAGVMAMEAAPDGLLELAGAARGKIEFDAEAMASLSAMSEQMLAANWSQVAELLLTSTKADVSFELSGSMEAEAFELEMSLLLTDGVLLLGAGAMEALTGESMTGIAAFGLDLNGAVAEVLGGEVMEMPEASHEDDMAALEAAATTITRLPDSQVNGVAVAVFETQLDMDYVFSLMCGADLLAAYGDELERQSAQELCDAVSSMNITAREYIGTTDAYTYRMEAAVDMTMAGDDLGLDSDGAFAMRMDFTLSGFNEQVEVEIPEDALVLPLAMMLQMNEQ